MFQVMNATIDDTASIQKLLRETWQDTYSDHLSENTLNEVYKNWQSTAFLRQQIENTAVYFPLAKSGDELIGLSTAQRFEDTIVMFRLYVSPQYQRQGIGELLLHHVMEHFQGATKIQLNVEAMNPKGLSFYRKQGFKEVKREQEKVVNDVIEVILMEKLL